MKIETEIQIYEIGGREIKIEPESNQLIVKNHWNRSAFVVLEIPGQQPITVATDELRRAIDASKKAHQW